MISDYVIMVMYRDECTDESNIDMVKLIYLNSLFPNPKSISKSMWFYRMLYV